MEVSKSDTEADMEASLEATYGAGLTAKTSVGTKNSKHNKNAQMHIKESCLGGNTSIWLGATADNSEAIQAKWAASVDDDNLHPLGMKLDFSWELVKALNPTFGETYETYLKKKWEDQGMDGNALEYVQDDTVSRSG